MINRYIHLNAVRIAALGDTRIAASLLPWKELLCARGGDTRLRASLLQL
jgi:hypothetical protein